MEINEFDRIRGALRCAGQGLAPFVMQIPGPDAERTKKRKSEQVLYHYTSLENFESILTSGSIWASSCLRMNDKEEVVFAANVLLDRILVLQNSDQVHFAKVYSLVKEIIVPSIKDDVFVISFSHKGNVLSQWRAYARNNGISFGVPIETIIGVCKEFNLYCGDAVYNHLFQLKLLTPIIERVSNEIKNETITDNMIEVSEWVIARFRRIAPFIKHPAFYEEAEFRVLILPEASPNLNVNSRKRNFENVPFIEVPLISRFTQYFDTPIEDIVIGPSNNVDLVSNRVMGAMEKFDLEAFGATGCGIPYDDGGGSQKSGPHCFYFMQKDGFRYSALMK